MAFSCVRKFISIWVATGLVACASTGNDSSPIVPEQSVRVFSGYQLAFEDIVQVAGAAVVAYYLIDPITPNWKIKETHLSDEHLLYDLSMKAINVGGDGEARTILLRRIRTVQQEKGFLGYTILRYEEGMDSRFWLPHRTAQAEVFFTSAPM